MQNRILNPEIVVYIYMASCVSVLVFHLLYIISDKSRGKTLVWQTRVLEKEIQKQICLIKAGKEPQRKHIRKMTIWLRLLGNLKAFEHVMQNMEQEPEEYVEAYRETVYRIFLKLVCVYEKRDEIERAYFARLIEQLKIKENHKNEDLLTAFLLAMVTDHNVYVRQNAYRALYAAGNPKLILEAWKRQEKTGVFHNKKLLTDGLLSFKGNRLELAELLWGARKEFSETLVLPIMQFIRFFAGDFRQQFLDVMNNPRESKELRLEAIRYFRRYPYEPAKDVLKGFLKEHRTGEWEYAAVAAQSLASYPDPEIVDILKYGLSSVNWYIRLNCAETLIKGMKIPKLQLYDVYNGRDRYAREILEYVSETMEKSG